MKLTFTLLVASLASSVSAGAYELCCCTKTADNGSGYYGCHRDATQTIVNATNGAFAFTTHSWVTLNGAPYMGEDYIYATGKDGGDNLIGAKEMAGWCKKQKAGQSCWSPGDQWAFNYKGERIG